MKTTSGIPTTALYADEAPGGLIEPPTSPQFHAGVEPEMTLPAAWWNYFANLFTNTTIQAKSDVTGILAELNNLLTALGITPDPLLTNQIAEGITGAITDEATARSAADTAHANATSVHGATDAATASRIIMRDANGRAKIADPVELTDIANKATVYAAVASASARSKYFYETGTFTVPAGVTDVYLTGVGKGGAGGASIGNYGGTGRGGKGGGGGGGAGQSCLKKRISVTPLEIIDVELNLAGSVIFGTYFSLAPGYTGNAGTCYNDRKGGPGGDGGAVRPGSYFVSGGGGGGGGASGGQSVGGISGPGGDAGYIFTSAAGIDGYATSTGKAGDGGSSEDIPGGQGYAPSGSYQEGNGGGGGAGANSPWGKGGKGGNGSPGYEAQGSPGANASGYGAGGGGAGGTNGKVTGNVTGGEGAPGFLLVEW